MRCPGCKADELAPFLDIESIPTNYNVPFRTKAAALASPSGSMRLGYCPACGLIFNLAFDPALIPYEQGYENSLHFSPRFDGFARDLASRLIDKYDLRNKLILEVGCGRGDFLCMLCEDGNRGIGFDPSYAGTKPERRGAENVTITAEPFAGWQGDRPVALVCCRHTLEHVLEPLEFLEGIQQLIERGGGETAVYFEVPNAGHMLETAAGVWDITYEHPSYFTASALAAVFAGAGFTITGSSEAFEGQFLSIEGTVRGADSPRPSTGTPSPTPREAIERFGDTFRDTVRKADADLSGWLREGLRPVVWGGGSKGITFLNSVPAARQIEYVVDINPHKQGLFVPGTGQRFVAPDFLREYRPGVVVLMNAIYRDEVRSRLAELGLEPEIFPAGE